MTDAPKVLPILVRITERAAETSIRFLVLEHPNMLRGVIEYLSRPGNPSYSVDTVTLDTDPAAKAPWILDSDVDVPTEEEANEFFRILTREARAQERRTWAGYCESMVTLIDAGKSPNASARCAFATLAKIILETKGTAAQGV